MTKSAKVGFIQNVPAFLKVEDNLAACLEQMEAREADLWVLPEFFATGYRFKTRKEVAVAAEAIPGGRTTQRLLELSARRKCAIVAGLPEKSGTRFYNSAVLIERGQARTYRKTHLFGDEKKFFRPGNTGFWVKKAAGIRVGVMICFDWFFPEAARTLALQGAELIAHPANLVLPWGPEAMKTRSLENRVYAVTANRAGFERGLRFIGQSQITDPRGCVLARAAEKGRAEGTASIEPARARDKRVTAANDLFRDRRPTVYRR